jgi:hypothetical protein
MFIDENRKRIMMFVVIADNPLRRAPTRYWYQRESTTSISVRLRLNDAWRVHEFLLEGDRLSWTYGGEVHPWRRVPWEERPDWLDTHLATENSKMDAAEDGNGQRPLST